MTVALDLGPGTLANLQLHCGLGDLDAVVLSHSHPDHWVDLTGLAVAWEYALRRTGLPVYGTPETGVKARAVMGDLAPTMQWHDVGDGDQLRLGGLALDFSSTDHYVPTVAVRVAEGASTLAYSADTGPGWSFAAFGAPVDLALCEATNLTDGEGDGVKHLSARQAGEMARACGVGRLVLTHQFPGSDPVEVAAEGARAFGRPVEVAAIHAQYDV